MLGQCGEVHSEGMEIRVPAATLGQPLTQPATGAVLPHACRSLHGGAAEGQFWQSLPVGL